MFKRLSEKWKTRPKRKQRISYGRKIRYNWDIIEDLNYGLGITRDSCSVGNNGYLRWKSNNRLCHRDIAFDHVYKGRGYKNKFSDYDIHHKDENKHDNNPSNLEMLLRQEHQLENGQILYENGQKYIRLVNVNRHRKQTNKAILIGGKRGT